MRKLLKPILAHQNTPHSPNHEKQCALNSRQLDQAHVSARDHRLGMTQQFSVWLDNLIELL